MKCIVALIALSAMAQVPAPKTGSTANTDETKSHAAESPAKPSAGESPAAESAKPEAEAAPGADSQPDAPPRAIKRALPAVPRSAPRSMQAAMEQQQASLALQRESVKQQAAMAGLRLTPWSPPPEVEEAPCDRIADSDVAPIIEKAAHAEEVKEEVLRAVIAQESAYRPCAVSAKGAEGLMQLMPATAEQFNVRDPFDPAENIEAGAKYLKLLLGRYNGDLSLALGAYNAGPSPVDMQGAIPDIPETQKYVESVLQTLAKPAAKPETPKP
jgi:soluble lytic murein transglycosylase-like protein